MLKIIIVNALVALIALLILFAIPSKASYIAPPEPQNYDISYLITLNASKFGIDESVLRKVIKCESGFNPQAINYNDGGKGKHSVGILQFQESTFDYWSKIFGEELDYYSYYDQLKLGSYMFSKGEVVRKQWTCWRKHFA